MPTIGEQLKQSRESQKLTIKQAALATRVGAHYLEAIEADDMSALPSNVQARGFLRLYIEFLGLNADELIARQQPGSDLETLLPATGENKPAPEPAAAPKAEPRSKIVPAKKPAPEPVPEPKPVPPPGPPPLSQTIFNEIGRSLRERRELISLTLDEVERHTHVRKHNLEMIEAGLFDELASPVQARGMLSAYASFLDMDAEAVLLRYADALQSRRRERQQAEPARPSFSRRRISLPVGLRRFISPDLIFGGSMIVIMLALSVWGAARIFSGNQDVQATPTTSGPSISDVLLASPVGTLNSAQTAAPTSLAEVGTVNPGNNNEVLVTETETPESTAASAVQITVIVVDRTFLRVIVDGEVKQDGRVPPGSALTFDGNERIEVLTGSGTAVQIIYNQRNMGLMGNMGEVVNRIYTISGVETPTPTPSPTPTITPKPSRTLRPTLTSLPTATPRPTSTLRPTSTSRPTSTINP